MDTIDSIRQELSRAGYAHALAVATRAEVESGAACGQLALLTIDRCDACRGRLEPGAPCWNPDCPEGKDNLLWEMADREYHAMADAQAEAQWEVDG